MVKGIFINPTPFFYLFPPAALMEGLKPFLPHPHRGEIIPLKKKLIEVSLL